MKTARGIGWTLRLWVDDLRQLELKLSLAASEVSYLFAPVLLFRELVDEDIQRVLRPLLNLLPVSIVVVREGS